MRTRVEAYLFSPDILTKASVGSLDSRAVLDRRTKSPDTKAHAGGAGGARVNWSTLGKNITREKICILKVKIETTSDLIEQLLIAIHLDDSTYF